MTPITNPKINFRYDETRAIMDCWKEAQSVSLVGIGSVGKSNLLQHVTTRAVQRHFLGDAPADGQFRAISLDPYLMALLPANADAPARFWAGCELLMNRLYLAFQPFDILGERDARVLYETYQAFQDGDNPMLHYLGLRYLEFALELFLKRGVQIVFVFDEFEAFLSKLPVQFFLALRGLRDAHKHLLSYTTFTRAPLLETVERLGISTLAIEPFVELFTDNVIYVGAYSEEDARAMLETVMARKEKRYDPLAQNFMLWATGGHAGLLRAATEVFDLVSGGVVQIDTSPDKYEAMLATLAAKLPVRAECDTIWKGLNADEQACLKAISTGAVPSASAALDQLMRKGLVARQRDAYYVQPPVLGVHVRKLR